MRTRLVAVAAVGLALSGCQGERVAFNASVPGQTAIVRDGKPALVSKKKASIVLVAPAPREMQAGQRPIYVIAATNLTGAPVDLRIDQISAVQTMPSGSQVGMPVIPYEQLVGEEKTRQVVRAVLVGAAVAANSYSAARSGYGTESGTVFTPRGTATYTANYYSPTANAVNQAVAGAQNEAMIANAVETGQRNLGALSETVLKDNTIMPGEWIGGQVHFSPPVSEGGGAKSYTISVTIGGETHNVEVTQGQAQTS